MNHGISRNWQGTRTGFTLIEMLVVVTIIGTLAGLMFPALQMVREASRHTQCTNNLRQIGIAFNNYEHALGGFPPRRWSRSNEGYTGWGTFLLPFLEQKTLYSEYNWQYDFYDPVNKSVVEMDLPVFICPSTPKGAKIPCSGKATAGSANTDKSTTFTVDCRIDYLAPNGFAAPTTGWGLSVFSEAQTNSGNAHQALMDSTTNSSFANALSRAPRKLSEIRDGVSNTLLINETAGWPHHYVNGVEQTTDLSLGNRGSWAGWQSFVYLVYSADGTMNSSSDPTEGDLLTRCVNCDNKNQIYSFHPGGANVLFCDGSVRFMGESLDGLTFSQIVFCDDGQVIDQELLQP